MDKNKYSNISREEILSLKNGEVISFYRTLSDGKKYQALLLVDSVDTGRGVVTGRLVVERFTTLGVNAVSIEKLVQNASNVALWKNEEKADKPKRKIIGLKEGMHCGGMKGPPKSPRPIGKPAGQKP